MIEAVYMVNGYYFKSSDVYVSSGSRFEVPEFKSPEQFDWAEYNGLSVDLKNRRIKERKITLNCWIKTDNLKDALDKYNRLMEEFYKDGQQQLFIQFGDNNFVFMVYLNSKTNLKERIYDKQYVWEFTLELIEPNPIKQVYVVSYPTFQASYHANNTSSDIFVGNKLFTQIGDVPNFEEPFPVFQISNHFPDSRNLALGTSERILYVDELPYLFALKKYELLKNKTITVKFKARAAGELGSNEAYFRAYLSKNTSDANSQMVFNPTEMTQDWTEFKKVLEVYGLNWSDNEILSLVVDVTDATFGENADMEIKDISVRFGDDDLDYFPAPENAYFGIIAGHFDDDDGILINEVNGELIDNGSFL